MHFLKGGLEYQIEHHLFPSMPRNNCGKASKIIKAFCQQQAIPHYEAGVFQTYKEILQHFHKIGSVVRNPNPDLGQVPAAN